MNKAFIYQNADSHKFWRINYSDCQLVVNYGKFGTAGKYELKEFDTPEQCAKQAEKLISSKIKKGYQETADFDYNNHLYFDVECYQLNSKTSHPNFIKHFTEDFYYDCSDEQAPFGSDEGFDTLQIVQERLRKNSALDFATLPKTIIEKEWDMKYLPVDSLKEEDIKKLAEKEPINITQSDMVTYSTAFAQIKITGKINQTLKADALKALERFILTAKVNGWADDSPTLRKMIADLSAFN